MVAVTTTNVPTVEPAALFHALAGTFLWEQPGIRTVIGLDPVAVATSHGGRLRWTGHPVAPGTTVREVLRAIPDGTVACCVLGGDALRELPVPAPEQAGPERAGPEQAGPEQAGPELPDSALVFPGTLIIVEPDQLRLVASTQQRLDDLVDQVATVPPLPPLESGTPVPDPTFDSEIPDGAYERMIAAAHQRITAGEARQVTISRRFVAAATADPLAVHRVLRDSNPSPYHFLLRLPGVTVVGASPQGLIRTRGAQVTVPVIAGTRRRDADPAADAALAAELLADPKERDEHAMLVELARADLAGVAAPGTVRVADGFPQVHRYGRVMHLVSEVTGELGPGVSPVDALAHVFPAGTVTGTPRAAALRIIDDLEPRPRGLYGGAVGLRDAAGDLDLCLGIRTLQFHGGVASCQAGAGVVAGSVPDREVRESRDKASALFAALG